MKLLVLILVIFLSINASAQQLTTEIRSDKGVFTERLFLKDKWIDRISTDLNSSDSASDNVLVTARAIANFARLKAGNPIQNQFSVAQPASFWIQGSGTIGALPNYCSALSAQMNITQNALQHGFSIQQANNNSGFPGIELFKNASNSFNTLQAVQPGDSIGSIIFSGVAGDNNTIANAMSMHGLVEATAPSYVSSGFVFNTTDTNGIYAQRMWLNGSGNLLLGNETTNPYALNVSDGEVRVNSLSGGGNVLVASDNDGVLKKVVIGYNLYTLDGVLLAGQPPRYRRYMAMLTQQGTGNPSGWEFEDEFSEINWTRVSTGIYTATVEGAFASGFTLFKSEASDENGNAMFVKMHKSAPGTIMLEVKDASRNYIDNWKGISVEIKEYIQYNF